MDGIAIESQINNMEIHKFYLLKQILTGLVSKVSTVIQAWVDLIRLHMSRTQSFVCGESKRCSVFLCWPVSDGINTLGYPQSLQQLSSLFCGFVSEVSRYSSFELEVETMNTFKMKTYLLVLISIQLSVLGMTVAQVGKLRRA